MGPSSLAASHPPLARGLRIFLIHQSLAAWGPLFLAPAMVFLLCEQGWRFGIKTYIPQVQWALYGTRFFPTQIGLALLVGWILGGTLPHRAMLWVWALPLVALCFAFFSVPLLPAPSPASVLFPPINDLTITQTVTLGFAYRLSYFFGPAAGLQPYNQVVATLPLYSALAYSLGAWLATSVLRAPLFFQTMRDLRKSRLLLIVAVPWFCVKLALDWQQASAQYPTLRTWPVLRAALVGLTMCTVFLTSVFALVIGIVGRRFSLTRFFLRAGAGASER